MSIHVLPEPAHPGLTVLCLPMEAGLGGDPFTRWAVDDCGMLLETLQAEVRGAAGGVNVAVVVAHGDTADPWEAAAMHATLEAVRGVVHSLTPELGATARINVIACRDDAGDERVQAALRFVASPGGAYVAGSTFDLREDS